MDEYAVTVYSTDDTEENAFWAELCDEQDERDREEYNAHLARKAFSELEDAVGYDKAVEISELFKEK